jgi:hypothetical protein
LRVQLSNENVENDRQSAAFSALFKVGRPHSRSLNKTAFIQFRLEFEERKNLTNLPRHW